MNENSRKDAKSIGRFLSALRTGIHHHTSTDGGSTMGHDRKRSRPSSGRLNNESDTPSTIASPAPVNGVTDHSSSISRFQKTHTRRDGRTSSPRRLSGQNDPYPAESPSPKLSDGVPRVQDFEKSLNAWLASPIRHNRANFAESAQERAHLQRLVKSTLDARSGNGVVRFSWRVARAFVLLKTQPADTFAIGGVPFAAWPKTKIPTLGASPAGCRVQEMYKVMLPGVGERGKDVRLFVKVVPIGMWRQQWEAQNKWNGEYATDGENFVMEAAVLAFLHEYAPGVAPKLMGILELSVSSGETASRSRNAAASRRGDNVTHMVIISELYGEDLLDYLDRRDRKDKPLSKEEKQALQLACVLLMKRLHQLGLAHLDFTPENILLGPDGLRLCDFAKATPLWSPHLRHCPISSGEGGGTLSAFESCEPTVGKGAYMPPECWKVYWKLETQKIVKPLEDLASLRLPEERAPYYFRVSSADVYMLGVVIFWIWSEGGIWRTSDPRQDEKFYHLVKSGMNFDLFRECRGWPPWLKECVSRALKIEPYRRATITELMHHPWFAELINEGDPQGYLRAFAAKGTTDTLFTSTSTGPTNS